MCVVFVVVVVFNLVLSSLCGAMLSHFTRVQLFVTLWTVAHQAPLSMGSSRKESWSGLPFPSSGDLPNPGIEHVSPALAGGFFTTEPPGKACKEGARLGSKSKSI